MIMLYVRHCQLKRILAWQITQWLAKQSSLFSSTVTEPKSTAWHVWVSFTTDQIVIKTWSSFTCKVWPLSMVVPLKEAAGYHKLNLTLIRHHVILATLCWGTQTADCWWLSFKLSHQAEPLQGATSCCTLIFKWKLKHLGKEGIVTVENRSDHLKLSKETPQAVGIQQFCGIWARCMHSCRQWQHMMTWISYSGKFDMAVKVKSQIVTVNCHSSLACIVSHC
jgi:hypothetical protein